MKIKSNDMSEADLIALERTPKAVLYAIAKHLAALATADGYDSAINNGEYLSRMEQEWKALHENGIVAQKPVSLTRPPRKTR